MLITLVFFILAMFILVSLFFSKIVLTFCTSLAMFNFVILFFSETVFTFCTCLASRLVTLVMLKVLVTLDMLFFNFLLSEEL